MLDCKVKYFEGATKLQKIDKGDWIDVYSREDIFIPKNEMKLVKLGFAMQLPTGYEAHLAPRSSTFKKWGIIQTNHVGVIDESYCGDNDEWEYPAYCLQPKTEINEDPEHLLPIEGTWIRKGDKIAQFRIIEKMPEITFNEVDILGNEDRKGFGSTGSR